MTALWKKARVEFERHPDGRFPPKTDAELEALYEKMKKARYDNRGQQEPGRNGRRAKTLPNQVGTTRASWTKQPRLLRAGNIGEVPA